MFRRALGPLRPILRDLWGRFGGSSMGFVTGVRVLGVICRGGSYLPMGGGSRRSPC